LHILCYTIGLKISYHFFIESEIEKKKKPIMTFLHILSCALHHCIFFAFWLVHWIICVPFDWLEWLLWFGFMTLNWKPLFFYFIYLDLHKNAPASMLKPKCGDVEIIIIWTRNNNTFLAFIKDEVALLFSSDFVLNHVLV